MKNLHDSKLKKWSNRYNEVSTLLNVKKKLKPRTPELQAEIDTLGKEQAKALKKIEKLNGTPSFDNE